MVNTGVREITTDRQDTINEGAVEEIIEVEDGAADVIVVVSGNDTSTHTILRITHR